MYELERLTIEEKRKKEVLTEELMEKLMEEAYLVNNLRGRMHWSLKGINGCRPSSGYYLHMATDNFGNVRFQINKDSFKRKFKRVLGRKVREFLGLYESPLRQVGKEQIADLGISFDTDKEGKPCKRLNGYVLDCEMNGRLKYNLPDFEKRKGLENNYVLRKPTQDLDSSNLIRD